MYSVNTFLQHYKSFMFPSFQDSLHFEILDLHECQHTHLVATTVAISRNEDSQY